VEIERQYGVTITSAFVAHGEEPSQHFRYIYHPWYKKQNNSAFYELKFPPQSCSLELLGFTEVRALDRRQGRFTMNFPLRVEGFGNTPSKAVDESEEQAHVSLSLGGEGGAVRLRCFCQQIQSVFHTRDFRAELHGAVVYFCPVQSVELCQRLDRRVRPAKGRVRVSGRLSGGAGALNLDQGLLNVSLTTAYKNTDGEGITTRQVLHNSFVMLPLSLLPTTPVPDTGVCAVINYGSSLDGHQEVMGSVSRAWLRHYGPGGLKMRVMLFDLVGHLATGAGMYNHTGAAVDYHNYTIFGKLGHVDPSIKHDPTWTSRNKRRSWLLDSDKMATLTHCRFEARALYGLMRVLVVDTDEFLHCNPDHNGYTRRVAGRDKGYAAQRALLQDLVRRRGAREAEISLPQAVPYKLTQDGIRECIGNATAVGESIFTCISSIKHLSARSSKLKKNIHTGIMCPWTNYHNACVYHVGNVYACACPIEYVEDIRDYSIKTPGIACNVVHFEFKPVNKYKTDTRLPVSELVAISASTDNSAGIG